MRDLTIYLFKTVLIKHQTLLKKEDLIKVFENLKLSFPINMVFTCGSGVTACILGMANSIINDKTPLIYDGSWAEYGRIEK